MKNNFPWPDKTNKIIEIRFELMIGFNHKGNPILKQGSIVNNAELQTVQEILEPLKPQPAAISSTTIGKVVMTLSSGESVVIKPVFHPSLGVYKDLFKVEHFDFPMPDEFADILNKWRRS